jgi:putative serine protease PepD
MIVAVLAAGLIGGGAGAGGVYLLTRDDQTTATAPSALDSAPSNSNASTAPAGSVQAVADKVLPSVVSITINTGQGTGGGSGIILSADGQILTNNHVAEAGELEVTFQNGKTVPARVVGLDPVTDLAVIKAQGVSGLKAATLGSSDTLKVGQEVVAIGAPIGLRGTVTSGIVSALNRPVNTGSSSGQNSETVIDAIQTDAAINPGNSGGALLDMSGRVVGINTAIAQVPQSQQSGPSGNIGLGFAIPIDEARPIAKQLAAGSKPEHALLGVQVGTAQGNGGTTVGAVLGTVTEGSAAAAAGLQEGDVVTKLDSRAIADGDSLVAAVRSHRPGDEVTLTFVRNGQEKTAKIKLGSDR